MSSMYSYCMILMYEYQIMSNKRNIKLLLSHPRSLLMKSWSFLPIQKRGVE